MTCGETKRILTDMALGEAAPEVRAEASRHLEGCAACRATLADLELTRKLLVQGLPEEEVPRRIAFVGAPAPASGWRALLAWRPVAAPLAVAVALVLVLGTLTLARTRVVVEQGRWEIAFGIPPAAAPQQLAPAPAQPAASGHSAFTREQVANMVAAAVQASEERQRAQTASLIEAASSRMEKRQYVALSALAEQMHYFESTQNTFYKQSEGTQAALQLLAARLPAGEKGDRP